MTAGADAYRWQAAMGAVAGTVIADALVDDAMVDDAAVDDASEGPAVPCWSSIGTAMVGHAEELLGGGPVAFDLVPAEALGVAVGLFDGAIPLLGDPATIAVIDHVRSWLGHDRSTGGELGFDRFDRAQSNPAVALTTSAALTAPAAPNLPTEVAEAIDRARSASGFVEAVEAAPNDSAAVLVGGLYGLAGGIGSIPARLASTVVAPDGRRGRRYLARLVDRLLGLHRIDWYEPRHRRGPREALPGVWLSNIYGIDDFVDRHPDGLVVSLCDIEGRLDDHDNQVTFHLDDTPQPAANPCLSFVLDEVLAEIGNARELGQPVLVHCRHGASRTGLVLRLLLIADLGLDPESALMEAQCVWPHTSTWNTAWAREIERRCS